MCSCLQIGHNVVIGKSCMLCGQVGIAGSVTYVLSLPLLISFLIKKFTMVYDSLPFQCLSQLFKNLLYLIKMSSFSSCRVGDYVTMGGRVAVRDHVSIVSKVFV